MSSHTPRFDLDDRIQIVNVKLAKEWSNQFIAYPNQIGDVITGTIVGRNTDHTYRALLHPLGDFRYTYDVLLDDGTLVYRIPEGYMGRKILKKLEE